MERAPEVRGRLSFISLVQGGTEVEEAAAHFGAHIAMCYGYVRRQNRKGKVQRG